MGSLRARREALGWTQERAGQECGLTQMQISAAERGKASARHAERITAALTHAEYHLSGRAEEDRIARQREVAHAVPESREWAALRQAMGRRALDRLEACDPEGCDLLLEFLPEAEATALLGSYFGDGAPDA